MRLIRISTAVLFVATLVTGGVLYLNARHSFDATVWKEWSVASRDYNPKNPRGRMVVDLLNKHLPLGRQRSDVLAMLGKPDVEDGNHVQYYVGGHSGGAYLPGYDYLMLTFDADGKLATKCVKKSD
jgi:hypothetical protein